MKPADNFKQKSLSEMLYSDETFTQKLHRIGKKAISIALAGISICAVSYPVYTYFNKQKSNNLSSFLEEIITSKKPPLEKVCMIEEGFKDFSVLEYISFFDYDRFLELHESIFKDFYSSNEVKTNIKLNKNPDKVLSAYYNALERAGFGYFADPQLGQGFMQKKLNCVMRTLMFLSDLNYKLGMPVFGAVGKDHTLIKYDDGQKEFFFDTVSGKIKNSEEFADYKIFSPEKFIYAALRNYVVVILRRVWKERENHYVLSNYRNLENACKSAIEISNSAKNLNPNDGLLYLADAWAYACLGDLENAKKSFSDAMARNINKNHASKFIQTISYIYKKQM